MGESRGRSAGGANGWVDTSVCYLGEVQAGSGDVGEVWGVWQDSHLWEHTHKYTARAWPYMSV